LLKYVKEESNSEENIKLKVELKEANKVEDICWAKILSFNNFPIINCQPEDFVDLRGTCTIYAELKPN